MDARMNYAGVGHARMEYVRVKFARIDHRRVDYAGMDHYTGSVSSTCWVGRRGGEMSGKKQDKGGKIRINTGR